MEFYFGSFVVIAKGLHTNLNRSNQESSIPFRPDIEGLRALAVESGGQVIHRDGDHLTASYSRSLAAALLQRLRDSGQ